jgi:hypothetical protein
MGTSVTFAGLIEDGPAAFLAIKDTVAVFNF